MSAVSERRVDLPGGPCRVLEGGTGEPLGVLAGLGGFPHWTPFLDRLAAGRRVIAPSFPGFPGGSGAHKQLDDIVDWVVTTLDLFEAAGLAGADTVGLSIGGALVAEAAAVSPTAMGRLILVAPFGLQDESEPTRDPYGVKTSQLPSLLCNDRTRYGERFEVPEGADPEEWIVVLARAHETAARLLWPTGDRGLAKRLHRIRNETLLVWGGEDRLLPPSYAKRFAAAIAGRSQVRSVEGAGHLVDLDAPENLAATIEKFLTG